MHGRRHQRGSYPTLSNTIAIITPYTNRFPRPHTLNSVFSLNYYYKESEEGRKTKLLTKLFYQPCSNNVNCTSIISRYKARRATFLAYVIVWPCITLPTSKDRAVTSLAISRSEHLIPEDRAAGLYHWVARQAVSSRGLSSWAVSSDKHFVARQAVSSRCLSSWAVSSGTHCVARHAVSSKTMSY
jgi:hypothetical protein